MPVRIIEWKTENPQELKRQLRVFEDYVRSLERLVERLRKQVEELTP